MKRNTLYRFWYFIFLIPMLLCCQPEIEEDMEPVIEEPVPEPVIDGGLDTLGNWQWLDFDAIELVGDDIVFASPDTVYLINKIFYPFPGMKVSYDGGNTWLPEDKTYNIIKGYNTIHVIDHDEVFLFGKYVPMLSQSDYNARIYSFNFNDLYTSTYRNYFYANWYGYIADVYSRGGDVYVLTLSGRITIRGKSDVVEYDLKSFATYESIAFASDSVGFIGSDDGEILITQDRSQTWESKLKDPDSPSFVELFFYSSQLGFALTNTNVLYRTADGGESWNRIVLPHNSKKQETYRLNKKIVMVDESRGFTNYGKEVFETKDGGLTWTRTLRVGQSNVDGIAYDQRGAIWAVAGAGLLKLELN